MFHVNLKNKRLLNNLSQKQVADYLNISHQSVSKWENGDALPSIEYLPKLAECMNCSIDDFFAKEKAEIREYIVINDYFSLMSQLFHEIKTTDDVISFVQEKTGVLDEVRTFCKDLMEHKMIMTKYIQNVFDCSVTEAKTLLKHLKSCELIEESDNNSLYIVVRHAVEGMLMLLRAYSMFL